MNSLLELYPLGHLILALIEVILLIFAYPFFRISRNLAMITFQSVGKSSRLCSYLIRYVLGSSIKNIRRIGSAEFSDSDRTRDGTHQNIQCKNLKSDRCIHTHPKFGRSCHKIIR